MKDVTQPGHPEARSHGLVQTQILGGQALLSNAWLNKGTNFTFEERQRLNLLGLLPPVFETLDLQARRVCCQLTAPNLLPINKYNILKEILSTNARLYYKVLIDQLKSLASIVYTPTVGEACLHFDQLYREPSGMYLSAFHSTLHRMQSSRQPSKNTFQNVLRNWPSKNVQIIVVTDGSRILGLGDVGANGMAIPMGKISLFVAAGGFHPEHSLPLFLDVGTNNQELLNDPFYMGERKHRLEGEAYWEAVQEMCDAVRMLWPHALLQFEDFETSKAFEVLQRYRHRQLCFNDDIQGTGAVVTAGIVNGLKLQGTDPKDARILFYGAGSSAVGVAEAIASYLESESSMSKVQARQSIYMFDSKGMIYIDRLADVEHALPEHKKLFARSKEEVLQMVLQKNVKDSNQVESQLSILSNLQSVVSMVKPHALIGLSAAGPSWDRSVIQELCRHVDRPLVLPLSNPTEKSEITAKEALEFSHGKAVFASGSPFDPVELDLGDGKKVCITPGQANNVLTFPGVGFGSVMSKAAQVTDAMFTAAAKAIAGTVTDEELYGKGQLYPSIERLREVSAIVAAAVAEKAYLEGMSGLQQPPKQGWLAYIQEKMWSPDSEDVLIDLSGHNNSAVE